MNLQIARQKFFAKHPSTFANFTINERLNKPVCFVFDYSDEFNGNLFITPAMQEEIVKLAQINHEDPIFAVIDYFSHLSPDDAERVSTFYYECVVNEVKFDGVKSVCAALNKFMEQGQKNTQNQSNRSIISAYLVNEDGSLDDNRIFYMDVTFGKLKSGQKVCTIENTFTEDEYKGKGLHSYSIKFLESVAAKKGACILIGESQECDVYESENNTTLAKHYQNLGFEVTTDACGVNRLVKMVDPDKSIQITADNGLCK